MTLRNLRPFCFVQEVVIGDSDGVTLPDPSEKFEELLMRYS